MEQSVSTPASEPSDLAAQDAVPGSGGCWFRTSGPARVHLLSDKRLKPTPDVAPDLLC